MMIQRLKYSETKPITWKLNLKKYNIFKMGT